MEFFVPGKPATAGSKRGFGFKRKDGSIGVAMAPDNKRQKPWMAAVASSAVDAIGDDCELIRGPVKLAVTLVFARPKSHMGKRGLRPSAPQCHITKPDSLKCVRAIEDALSGVIWKDDSQVVEHQIAKVYGEPEGAIIRVLPREAKQ